MNKLSYNILLVTDINTCVSASLFIYSISYCHNEKKHPHSEVLPVLLMMSTIYLLLCFIGTIYCFISRPCNICVKYAIIQR